MEITRDSSPPPPSVYKTKFQPVYDALEDAGIGEWIRVDFETPNKSVSARSAISNHAKKAGIKIKLSVRLQYLYILKEG